MELIKVSGLSKRYGKLTVLDHLSVSYESSRIYGLAGENGAGKTTLFDCIMGISPCEGSIQKKAGLRIGYLPAENYFYTLVTGREYIEFCMKAKGKHVERKRIEDLNEMFQLPLHRYASEYSTGMKKKLALMALLLQDNDFYILDEPFNGVDLFGCIRLKKIIRTLQESDKTVLLSSHQITVLQELCDCIDYLHNHVIARRYTHESMEEIEKEILAEACGASR